MIEMIGVMRRALGRNSQIFSMYLPDIAKELGEGEELPEDHYATHIWDTLLVCAGLWPRGIHVSFGRWMSWLGATKDRLKYWSARLAVVLLLGLQQGFRVQIGDLIGADGLCCGDGVGEAGRGAVAIRSPKAQSNVQMAKLRTATNTAVHVALVFLLWPARHVGCRVLSMIAGPFRNRYAKERARTNDAHIAVCLHCHIAIGSGIRTINEAVLLFQGGQFCNDIGASPPLHEFHPQQKFAAMLEGQGLANLAAEFWMCLARRRFRSQLPFFKGWPHRFCAFRTGVLDAHADCMRDFNSAHELWLLLAADVTLGTARP